jgi:hypothetical protein
VARAFAGSHLEREPGGFHAMYRRAVNRGAGATVGRHGSRFLRVVELRICPPSSRYNRSSRPLA